MTDSRVDTIVVCALNSTICLIEIETSNNIRFVIEVYTIWFWKRKYLFRHYPGLYQVLYSIHSKVDLLSL